MSIRLNAEQAKKFYGLVEAFYDFAEKPFQEAQEYFDGKTQWAEREILGVVEQRTDRALENCRKAIAELLKAAESQRSFSMKG